MHISGGNSGMIDSNQKYKDALKLCRMVLQVGTDTEWEYCMKWRDTQICPAMQRYHSKNSKLPCLSDFWFSESFRMSYSLWIVNIYALDSATSTQLACIAFTFQGTPE